MALPLSLLFANFTTFVDVNGDPLANGSLYFYQAGTLIAQSVFADSGGVTSLGAVVALNASGQPANGSNPAAIFISPLGYKLIILDVNGATIHTQDQIEDVGAAFLSTLGTFIATGQKSATSPYTVTASDNFVSIAGGTVLLPAVASRTQAITVQNTSTSTATTVTANGAELINSSGSTFSLQAASSSQKLPAVTLLPYAALGSWLIQSGVFITP